MTKAELAHIPAHIAAKAEKPEPRSVISELAHRYGMEREAFVATLKATVMPSNVVVSNEEFAAFCVVAKEYDLNPLTKEIFAFPKKGGGIQPVVSVDGWASIINRRPEMDGLEFVDIREEGKLIAITCRIHRKDRHEPIECTEYMEECKNDKDTWKKWPARMLRHKSLIQCARYAFGLSGIVDPDEAERMNMIDVTPSAQRAFSRKSDRNEFERKMIQAIEAAPDKATLDKIYEENRQTLDILGNGSGADNICLSKIEIAFQHAENEVSQAEAALAAHRQMDRAAMGEIDNDDFNEEN